MKQQVPTSWKVLWKKDYISYHPKEVGVMEEDHQGHQMSRGHPTQGTMNLTTRVSIDLQTGQVMILSDQHLAMIKYRIQQKQKGFLKD